MVAFGEQGGAAEVFSRVTRDSASIPPPHATSAAALLTLIRNSLIHDDDDTLRLTLGAREAWWREASIQKAPTRWGLRGPALLARRGSGHVALEPGSGVDRAHASAGNRPGWRASRAAARGDSERVVLAPPRTRSATVALRPLPPGL